MIVMEVISREVRVALPWELLYADDLVVIAETEEDLIKRLKDDMQFGFVKGKGTTDAICTVRQMQENFRVKGKKLYFGFVDL